MIRPFPALIAAPLFVLAIIFSGPNTYSQDTFRDFVPLVTTRAEVEKKIGKSDKLGSYELDEGRVSILYIEARCDKLRRDCFCLAPIDTVLKIEVQPRNQPNIKDLGFLDPKNWIKLLIEGHVPGLEAYVNEASGISYEVNARDGRIRLITYEETEETCGELEQKARSIPSK